MSPAVHQFVPRLEPGAVGSHLLALQRAVRARGWASETFFYDVEPAYRGLGRPYKHYGTKVAAGPGDVLLYHVAVGSVLCEWLRERPEPLVLYYHNLTPPEFFDPWDAFSAYACTWGRSQLRRLADRALLAMAASGFSQRELLDVGYRDTAVVPILFDPTTLEQPPDAAVCDQLRARKEAEGGADWLFVGRLSPNKAQHDLIKAFSVYRRTFDPAARLHVIGGSVSPPYTDALHRFVTELGLDGAVSLPGEVPPETLAAHYRAADVYVCLSDHEGFCVPLLEAWHQRLPVVAYAAAAVPETLGDAGILLAGKAPAIVATAVHRVVTDEALRRTLVERGTSRLQSMSLARAEQRLLDVLDQVVSAAGRLTGAPR